jgi:hypothetical protein
MAGGIWTALLNLLGMGGGPAEGGGPDPVHRICTPGTDRTRPTAAGVDRTRPAAAGTDRTRTTAAATIEDC